MAKNFSSDARLMFLQIEGDLEPPKKAAHDADETLKSCIDLLTMVHEKSLKGYVTSKEEHEYVLASMGAWLRKLYPRKRHIELSKEERKRRSDAMKAYHAKKKRASSRKTSPAKKRSR